MGTLRFPRLFAILVSTMTLTQSPVWLASQSAKAVSPSATSQAEKTQANVLHAYGKLPLSFEANRGQTDARVKFLSRGSGYTLFLTGDEAVFSLRGSKAKRRGIASQSSVATNGRANG